MAVAAHLKSSDGCFIVGSVGAEYKFFVVKSGDLNKDRFCWGKDEMCFGGRVRLSRDPCEALGEPGSRQTSIETAP